MITAEEIETMDIEQVRLNFAALMSDIVNTYGDTSEVTEETEGATDAE